jgi:hypothetical protein
MDVKTPKTARTRPLSPDRGTDAGPSTALAVLLGHSNSPGMPVPKLRRDKDKPGEDPQVKRMREWDEFTDWVPRLENFLQAVNQQLADLGSKCQNTEVKTDKLGGDVHNIELYLIATRNLIMHHEKSRIEANHVYINSVNERVKVLEELQLEARLATFERNLNEQFDKVEKIQNDIGQELVKRTTILENHHDNLIAAVGQSFEKLATKEYVKEVITGPQGADGNDGGRPSLTIAAGAETAPMVAKLKDEMEVVQREVRALQGQVLAVRGQLLGQGPPIICDCPIWSE